MFTGIVATIGTVRTCQSTRGDLRLSVDSGALPLAELAIGDSVAVNGVCLTVVEHSADRLVVDVSAETLACTTLGRLRSGAPVNLELALRVGDRLGGHLVSGHVDGIGTLVQRSADARSQRLSFAAPVGLEKYIAVKGSVTVEGVSLTVNAVTGRQFEVNLIPHTLECTTLHGLETGDPVNLEVDLIARYVARLQEAQTDEADLSLRFLQHNGYA